MAAIGPGPLDLAALVAGVADARCGAIVTFVGVVRADEDPAGTVVALAYEAHPDLAGPALDAVEREVAVGGVRCAIGHRTGVLAAGEPSVAVAVAAPHRAEAFAACRHAVELLKQRVPIWKQARYDSGRAEWVPGVPL